MFYDWLCFVIFRHQNCLELCSFVILTRNTTLSPALDERLASSVFRGQKGRFLHWRAIANLFYGFLLGDLIHPVVFFLQHVDEGPADAVDQLLHLNKQECVMSRLT